MRCFLRQPSTPWIVFDKDGATPGGSVPEVPAILSATPMFPADLPGAHAAQTDEPSSLAVAADLTVDAAPPGRDVRRADDGAREPAIDPSLDLSGAPPLRRFDRRILYAALALFAIGLSGSGYAAVNATRSHRAPASALAASRPAEPAAARTGADMAPPDLAPAASPAKDPPLPPASAPAPSANDARSTSSARPAREQYGRLSIAGRARQSQVFLDGKRLLGSGARSFTVTCGPHQIAVGTKADAKLVDVPCNAETIISQ